MRRLAAIFKETVSQFLEERAPRMAAALAFYTAFSLAPLLIIVVAIAGLAFGQDAAQGKIVAEIQGLIGTPEAKAVEDLIESAHRPVAGTWAAIAGLITLLIGATGVVGELQDSLNTIWDVKPAATGGIAAVLKQRLASFAMILGIGFLLLVSLILSTVLTAVTSYVGQFLVIPDGLIRTADFIVSCAVIGVLFALIYKIVPDAKIEWRDVWQGAAAASLMFSIGKLALSYYIAHSGFASTYGAAASLVVLLLWVYYSAQILFFGAELTQVTTTRRRPVTATEGATKTLRYRPRLVGRK
jgi:membrane protein